MTQRTGSKTVTVHVPMKFSARGGRKTIISEIGPAAIPAPRTEDALLKALAKAFRWRRQIESGEYASITELAKAQRVNDSYACRLLRMTLLSPEIVTTILDGRPFDITAGQVDIGNAATEMTQRMTQGVLQPDGKLAVEPRMDVQHVADAVAYMAGLPLESNVPFLTVMATKMPLYGRG